MACFFSCFPIKINQRTEVVSFSTNNSNHQRQTESAGTNKGFRRTTCADPNGEQILHWSWIDRLVLEGRAEFTRPCNKFVIANIEQEVKLFGKQLIIIFQVKTEQRKSLYERATSRHHFSASA